jgi:aspartate/methionine/tyrosine aminotransferase
VPGFPDVSTAAAAVPASIFARLREVLATFQGDIIPLQIGDTYLPPPAQLHDIAWAQHAQEDLYAYGNMQGWGPLVEAIVAKARTKNGLALTGANIQVACGATHALSCAVQALCNPGDELVLLTPHWPLIKGQAHAFNVKPVETPFERLAGAITPRTAAIYYASPNNPDGTMLARAQLEAIAALAQRHDLWVLADEVYEDYGYDAQHLSIASLIPERTITVFSFAKSYAQAGLRIGYAYAPVAIAAVLKKLVNHSIYNVPVAMQRAAMNALTGGAEFLASAKAHYVAARDRALARLTAPAAVPHGGSYLWVDFSRWTGSDCLPILEACAARGVLLAPGSAFGDACHGFARLCFTGVPPARLDEGIDRINAVLAAR